MQALVAQATSKAIAAAELTAVNVLREIGLLSFSRLRDFYDERGNLVPIADWTESMSAQACATETIIKNVTTRDGKQDEVFS